MVTLNPKPEVFTSVPDKFKRQIFLNNVMRVKALLMDFVALCKFVESCLEWENFLQSILALVAFLLVTWYFQPYMFPIILLLLFLKHYVINSYLDSKVLL